MIASAVLRASPSEAARRPWDTLWMGCSKMTEAAQKIGRPQPISLALLREVFP